jgi:hypothetical protein
MVIALVLPLLARRPKEAKQPPLSATPDKKAA